MHPRGIPQARIRDNHGKQERDTHGRARVMFDTQHTLEANRRIACAWTTRINPKSWLD